MWNLLLWPRTEPMEDRFFFLNLLMNFNWRIVTSQYCGGFGHTSAWLSHRCTCVLRPEPISLTPYPSGLSQSTDFGCPASRIKPALGETGSEPMDHQGSPQEMNSFFPFFNSSFICVWHVKNYFALTFLNFVLFFRKWCQNSKQGAFVLFSRVFVFTTPGKRAMFWFLSLYFCYSSAKAHAVV